MQSLIKSFCFFGLLVLFFFVSDAQPEHFDIVIKRNSVVGNLIYGTVFLNGQEIGATFENNDLKIPTGSYKGLLRYNSGHNFVQSELGKMSIKGDFLLEASNVPGNKIPTIRTDILLHSGNLPKHSKGCILFGPAFKGPDGASTIDVNHPLRKLRLAFYGTDEPISTPNKNITITIVDDYINSFRGSGNSNTVNYGNRQSCIWSMQMQNAIIEITISKQNNSVIATLSNDEVEKTISGHCVSGTRFRDSYNRSGGGISGSSINITFLPSPTNHQKCNARFTGNITGNNITGTISWTRYDQAPILNYTVNMPITLTR
jgi:hypothetical protein